MARSAWPLVHSTTLRSVTRVARDARSTRCTQHTTRAARAQGLAGAPMSSRGHTAKRPPARRTARTSLRGLGTDAGGVVDVRASRRPLTDYLPSSVTAFANAETERAMREASESGQGHGIYIPSGALWGARDIQNMAHRGNLGGLTVTMKKAPHHLKLQAPLSHKLDEVVASGATGETVLFEGPCRELAPLAPNNTNTIAAAALAAHTLGMDGTIGRLVCDPSLEAHIVEVEVTGAANPGAPAFRCVTQRINPAAKGAVTGDATYASFMSSMLDAGGRGGGLHFC